MSLIETYKEKMILPPERELAGKTFSILGDTISTFSGTYNNETYKNYYDKDTPESASKIYSRNGTPLPVTYYPTNETNKVWWHFLIDDFKMRLLQNNSCVERRVSLTDSDKTPFLSGSSDPCAGCLRSQIETLKKEEEIPNYIFIQLGILDFINEIALGNYDGSTFLNKTIDHFEEFGYSYAMMLDRITNTYPNSKIYCMTIHLHDANAAPDPIPPGWPIPGVYPELNGDYISLKTYNERIKMLVKAFGAKIIDLENCGINYYNLDQTMDDYTSAPRGYKPNELGQELIYQAVRKALLYD